MSNCYQKNDFFLSETEGVIKFSKSVQKSLAPMSGDFLRRFKTLKKQLQYRQWFGLENGIGYGNLSLMDSQGRIFISASQTSHLKNTTRRQILWLRKVSIQRNFISARGVLNPSSESLSHYQIYQCDKRARCVIHVHDKRLWRKSKELTPNTQKNVEYGTQEMAMAIKQLCQQHKLRHLGVIVMEGHLGGILAWGSSVADAFAALKRLRRGFL